MEYSFWFFITSGIFLGWSLGANHAVNLFGTAVVSRMIKFKTTAIIAGLFVILGAVISGAGTTKTLTTLGAINAIAGSFTVALAVAISILLMTRYKLPVSTSQAIVGGIIGWNFFTGSPTNYEALTKIFAVWVASPFVSAVFAFLLFKLIKSTILKRNIHLLRLDSYTRIGLLIFGTFASYFSGANDIANVMGLFVSSKHFADVNIFGVIPFTGNQQLFLIGGIAIAIGIYTYGENVMKTVGKDLYKISPITGLVIVMAEFFVLIMFTSQGLESILLRLGLPTIPLVPISSSQAFIGAVIGVGLAKDPNSINFKVFGKISIGWVSAPIIAGIFTFISLFFVQNVFEQKVINTKEFIVNEKILSKIQSEGINTDNWEAIINKKYFGIKEFKDDILKHGSINNEQLVKIYEYAAVDSFKIDTLIIKKEENYFTSKQLLTIKKFHNKKFGHKIELMDSLSKTDNCWQLGEDKLRNKQISQSIEKLTEISRLKEINNN